MKNSIKLLSLGLLIILSGCAEDSSTGTDNNLPQIQNLIAQPDTIQVGTVTTITCTAVDPDQDDLIITWTAENGSFPNGASGVSVQWQAPATHGSYAITAQVSDGIEVIEESIEIFAKYVVNFTVVGSCSHGADTHIYEIKVKDNYAYIAGGSDGLRIIDISNPSSPQEAASFEPSSTCIIRDLDVDGNYVYLVNAGSINKIDISNPLNPIEIASDERYTNNIDVSGNKAICSFTFGENRGFRVYNAFANGLGLEYEQNVVTYPETIEDVCYWGISLQILTQDSVIGYNYMTGEGAERFGACKLPLGFFHNFDIWDNKMFLPNVYGKGFAIVGNANGMEDGIGLIYNLHETAIGTTPDICKSGNYVYTTYYNNCGILYICAYNIEALLNPYLSGQSEVGTYCSESKIDVKSNYAYVARSNSLYVIELDF